MSGDTTQAEGATAMHDLVIDGTALVAGVEVRSRISVDNGIITGVSHPDAYPVAAREYVRLAPDEVLIPGIVDTHVHINEPGRTHWEGFDCATAAAAAGGVTTGAGYAAQFEPADTVRPGVGAQTFVRP